jgi:ppGpp synthetase/RelA/SpoT-type nucleotidyltranferase
MDVEKPRDIGAYKKWLKANHDCEITARTQTYYESVTNRLKLDLERTEFWLSLNQNLPEYNDQYLLETGYSLIVPPPRPEVFMKPFESFLLKTFRKNILENKLWPSEPRDGWVLPNNWYSKINDIIRTLIVVKYLDGVEFLIEKIRSLCSQGSIECRFSLEAKEEGYYAAHLYTTQEFEIPKVTWDTEMVSVSLEIQITTQLQEVIRKLLHKYYEDRRKRIEEDNLKWQWDYGSDEFVANYLGHILHYVEGMIMDIREKQKEHTL